MTSNPQLIKISNLFWGGTDDSSIHPPTLYLGLATGTVSSNGAVTGEVNGGGYQRVAIANDKTSWSTAVNSATITNKVDFTFPESTTAWGNITYVFLSDQQATGTNALYYAALPSARSVAAHVTVFFKGDPNGTSGDITLSVTN